MKINPIEDIILFPSFGSVFQSDRDKCEKVLFAICTIDLGSIKKEWKNEKTVSNKWKRIQHRMD